MNSNLQNVVRSILSTSGKGLYSPAIELACASPEVAEVMELQRKNEIDNITNQIEKAFKDLPDYEEVIKASALKHLELHNGLGSWDVPKPVIIPAELKPLLSSGYEFTKAEVKGRFSVTNPNWLNNAADWDDQYNLGSMLKGTGYLVIWTKLVEVELFSYDSKTGDYLKRVVKLPSVAEVYKAR